MKKKDLNEKIDELNNLQNEEKFDDAHELAEKVVKDLFEEKENRQIVELDKKTECVPIIFEVAYAYNETGNLEKAEEIYEIILSFPGETENAAILNNLSNIKQSKGDVDTAFSLIKKAHDIESSDEVIERNYNNLAQIVQEREEKEARFKSALENVKKETEWALEKLSNFVSNAKKDREFRNGRIALPRWKFKALVGTDDRKAESLREQWLRKDYIKSTGERNEFNSILYEINPHLEKFIQKTKPVKLNPQWFKGFEEVNAENLEKVGYFELLSQVSKVSKKYKKLIQRDLDELVFNYFIKNRKSAIILAGSFVELLFTYHCEKKGLKHIEYTIASKQVRKKLYECTLSDFLRYFDEQQNMKSVVLHIGNLARVYRNFIHPGNELSSRETLDAPKTEIGFHSAMEIARFLLK